MGALLRQGVLLAGALAMAGCGDDGGGTTDVGSFDGLFDGVATGMNFPFDPAIVPHPVDPDTGTTEEGDVFLASYGTSQIMQAPNPSGGDGADAQPFYQGPDDGLLGAMAVSIPTSDRIWVAFEQGDTGDGGGIVVLSAAGDVLNVIDAGVDADAFANPGGLCWGGEVAEVPRHRFFLVNLGDGTAWRLTVADLDGTDPVFEQVGSGLATGTVGAPGTPGAGISTSSDLPQDGARGCAYHDGVLYVADAQNSRVAAFPDAATATGASPVGLEDAPSELVTYPTGVAINDEGNLVVISYDNAHAFVTLDLPTGAFVDNGLHDLNVNAGNYGVAVAHDTIWFTRANNQNGALRAVTRTMSDPPSTAGPFPPQ